MDNQKQAALAGYKVVDLSRVLAGPWASLQLADLGADVIKVERPGSGDETRAWGPPWWGEGNDRQSAYYLGINRNKRSIAINISQAEGQSIVRQLAADADVVLENFKQGALAEYALDYPSLQKINPQLVYCSITGFGQDGPYAKQAGYDFLIQGMGGLMSLTGRADGEAGAGPQKVGVALTDVLTGLYASNAILAALLYRDRAGYRSGIGQYIDMALLDVQVAALANQAMNYLVSEQPPQRLGNAHPNIVPYQDFATSDGHIILAIGNDGQFARFATIAGFAEWATDPRFQSNAARVQNRQILVAKIKDVVQKRSSQTWIDELNAAHVPCGPINNLAEVFADPQVISRQLQISIARDDVEIPLVASPLRLQQTPVAYRLPPPLLGEHSLSILRQLGRSEAEISTLLEMGIVAAGN